MASLTSATESITHRQKAQQWLLDCGEGRTESDCSTVSFNLNDEKLPKTDNRDGHTTT